ncbi:hypothetical protein RJ53_10790 [Methanocalculus chunghsingensis]|uniref:Uncharacterized protein n=1 Tax=Methanocalculus chunghsingensis TaxID=156457 RepID=A0A8J7WBJ6_9EURY|nr:hypothetical protein [Methanocalculus chunghsingensis]
MTAPARMRTIPLLHSDVAQQTIRGIEEAYLLFCTRADVPLRGPPESAKSCRYLEKDGRYKLRFPASHITIRNGYVTLGRSRTFKKQQCINLERTDLQNSVTDPARKDP